MKGRTLKLCVLFRWDFNFCVRSSSLRVIGGGKNGVRVSSTRADWLIKVCHSNLDDSSISASARAPPREKQKSQRKPFACRLTASRLRSSTRVSVSPVVLPSCSCHIHPLQTVTSPRQIELRLSSARGTGNLLTYIFPAGFATASSMTRGNKELTLSEGTNENDIAFPPLVYHF